MSKSEIKGLFFLPSGMYLPMGLNILQKLWWRFIPGVVVNVAWPVGLVRVPNGDNAGMLTESADPNDHYRPWMEQHVGRQGWDWDWTVGPSVDETKNYLTIKIRRKHQEHAIIAKLMWS